MKDSVLWKEAMAEGEQRTKRADILAAVEERFGQPSPDLAEQLTAIDDLDALTALFRLSLRCARLDELRDAVAARVAGR